MGIKLRFLFKSWNVAFLNVFLLRFITCPIGSDWILVVFSTVFEIFLMFSLFPLCSLSCLLFPYFVVGFLYCWRPSLHFLNVYVVALILYLNGCYLFYSSWSCLLGLPLTVKFVLFVVSVILLDFGSWMKLILMVIFSCYFCLDFWLILL